MNDTVSDTLAKLRKEFAAQLPVKLDILRLHFQRLDPAAWRQDEAETLHRLLHNLTGSAGTFGMSLVSDTARELQNRMAVLLKTGSAPSDTEWQDINSCMVNLHQIAHINLESAPPSLTPPPPARRLDRSPLIHLVEDDITQAEHLGQALRDEGYRVQIFNTTDAFRGASVNATSERPAAVVMDMVFSDGDEAGATLLAELKSKHQQCPPVVFASVRDDLPARLAAFRAGACRYMVKPLDITRLIDLLDELTGRQPPQPYRVLMVDDDTILLEAHATMLRAAGMEVHTLSQPLQILQMLKDFTPDVVVLDVYMPEASGPELAAVLRERDAQRHTPILFLSAETDMTRQLLALNLGGDDFLVKPVQHDHLVAAVTARARRARQNKSIQQRLETTLYEREREHHALNQHAIVSIADRAGNISYANDKFCEISGYTHDELLGQNHRLLKSNVHSAAFYQDLWHTISSGFVWQGDVCNRRKDGSLYWVASSITPFLFADGKPYQYVSIRTDISQVKAAEAALRINEERLRRGQLYANIGTWEWNVQTGALYWSERIAPLFGYPTGNLETTYDNFLAAIHPEDRDAVTAAVAACVEHDTPYDIEHRVVWPDGTVRWLQERGAVMRDAAGKPLQMLGVVQDIDLRKRAVLALSERERQLREAQTLARIGNWSADMLSGELLWSDEIYRIFGHEPGSFAPSVEAFQAAIHPDDRARVQASEEAARTTGRHDVVHRIVRPDGTVRHVHELAQAENDSSGQLLRLTGTVQDITERVQAEGQLQLFRRIFDASEQAIGVADGEGRILYINPAHVRSHQWPLQEIEGQHFSLFLGEKALGLGPEIIEKTNKGESWVGLLWQKRKDGSQFISSSHINALLGENGKPQYLFNILYDYSTELARQEELRDARDKAETANMAKSEFLSSMSHELRTPMNAILGFGQLLQYDNTLSDEHKDSVSEILRAGDHLLELINEVLDLAKVESGHIDLSLEPVELCHVVSECLSLIAILAEKRNIRISHSGLKGAGLRADRTRLKQVLLNLLSNAIKYNREGGTVHLDVQPHGSDRLRIRVTDTGPGIPAEKLQQIFQPFNRLNAENSGIEGTGIGLTITRRIIEMMGGSVDVSSEPGVGSTFWIELPIEAMHETESAGTSGGNIQAASQVDDNDTQHLVLYIEDNPSNLRLMTQILGRRKHIHLLTAHTPELGIELALARRPELILLDINMPGMDGYQVLEVLKASAELKSIPVVAVTANAMPRDIERGAVAGFDDYLTKPIDLTRLYNILDEHLRQRHHKSTIG